MDKKLMNELKLKNSHINNNDECSICYNNFAQIKSMYLLENCNHIFCKPCIFKQMDYDKYKQNFACPLCRTENKNIKYKINQNNSFPYTTTNQGPRWTYHLMHNLPVIIDIFYVAANIDDQISSIRNILNNNLNNNLNSGIDNNVNNNSELHELEFDNTLNFQIESDEQDIQLVMNQTNCTREEAINALNNNNNNLVNAIMELTMV